MHKTENTLLGNRLGATVIGYGFIAGLIAIVIVVVVTSIGANLSGYIETGDGVSSTGLAVT